jgi:hypothetical protein
MAQPVLSIPVTVLESVEVEIGRVVYRARAMGRAMSVDGARVEPTWAVQAGDSVRVTTGAKVPDVLGEIPREDHNWVLAAAVIIAARSGHPRRDTAGQPISFVWTDHVNVAFEGSTRLSRRHSWVKDPPAKHIRELANQVRVHVRSGD